MLEALNLIVEVDTEMEMIYIFTDNLTCEDFDTTLDTLTAKCDLHINGTWSESWIFEEWEVITEYTE